MTVDSHLISSIGKGVLVFAGVSDKDTRKEVEAMASKVLKMKMWPDEEGGTVRFKCEHGYQSQLNLSLAVEEERTRYQWRGPLR